LADRPANGGPRPPDPAASRYQRARALLSTLFPDAARVTTSRLGVQIALLAIVVGTVVSLLRTTGTGPLQSIWEEDARDILDDALNMPAAKAILRPVAGYYVIFPRLLGELATMFPISWAAAVLSISSALVTALLAVQIYVASGAHLSNRLARFLVSAPLLVAPTGENFLSEIYNRPVCLHFFAMYALFWLLLWTPSSRWGKAGLLSTVGMTAVSTILIIGYVPLALFRLYLRRDRLSLALLGLTVGGTALQVSSLMTGVTGRGAVAPRLDPIWTATTYLFWVVPNSLLGFNATERLTMVEPNSLSGAGPDPIVAVALAIPVLVVVIAIVAARRGLLSPKWLLGGLIAVYGFWLHAFMVSSNGNVTMRYLPPVELLLFAAMVVILIPAKGVGPRWSWAPLAALGVLILVVSAFNYRWDNTLRHYAPQWTDQIRQAANECRRDPALSEVIVRGGPQPFWSIVGVPCRELTGPTGCALPKCEYLDPPQSSGRPRDVRWSPSGSTTG
jgi:hypothetical protein